MAAGADKFTLRAWVKRVTQGRIAQILLETAELPKLINSTLRAPG